MNKKVSLGLMIAIVILTIGVTASITAMLVVRSFDTLVYSASEEQKLFEKITEIQKKVDKNLYGEVDEKALSDHLSAGYIEGLGDKYAAYYSAEAYEAKKRTNAGVRVGIGVTVQADESGYIRVHDIVEGTSAEKVGILPGDILIAVDGESVQQKPLPELVDMLSGKAETQVVVTIRRGAENMEFNLTRSEFDLQTVTFEMMEQVGYIKITGFNSKTPAQFANAVEKLRQQGVIGLMFDLRGNSGGQLEAAGKCIDLLVGEGDVVTAEYADGRTKVLYHSDSAECDLPMVVLQNANTASAAELFSASLRDFGKAAIVGTQSYGKGVMQSTYELSDGSAISITTAKLYPNSMVSFHEIGIAPSHEVTMTKQQEQQVQMGDHTDDPQLMKALEILNVTEE